MPSNERELKYKNLGAGSGNKNASEEVIKFVSDLTREAGLRAMWQIKDIADLAEKDPEGTNRQVDVLVGAGMSVMISCLHEAMMAQGSPEAAAELAQRVLKDVASFTLVGCNTEEAERRSKNEHQ